MLSPSNMASAIRGKTSLSPPAIAESPEAVPERCRKAYMPTVRQATSEASTRVRASSQGTRIVTLKVPPATSARPSGVTLAMRSSACSDFTEFVDAWTLFENDRLRFSFEYPLIHDEIPSCDVQQTTRENGTVTPRDGTRIEVIVQPNPRESMDEYIGKLTEAGDNVQIATTPVAGAEGRLVSYRYGGLGRLQEVQAVDCRSGLAASDPCVYGAVGM